MLCRVQGTHLTSPGGAGGSPGLEKPPLSTTRELAEGLPGLLTRETVGCTAPSGTPV